MEFTQDAMSQLAIKHSLLTGFLDMTHASFKTAIPKLEKVREDLRPVAEGLVTLYDSTFAADRRTNIDHVQSVIHDNYAILTSTLDTYQVAVDKIASAKPDIVTAYDKIVRSSLDIENQDAESQQAFASDCNTLEQTVTKLSIELSQSNVGQSTDELIDKSRESYELLTSLRDSDEETEVEAVDSLRAILVEIVAEIENIRKSEEIINTTLETISNLKGALND